MGLDAPTAEPVTDEPGEAPVILGDLDELAVPSALPAPVADGAPLGDALGGYQVAAVMVGGPAAALAAVAANIDANLVQPVGLSAGGEEPAAAALVGVEDLAGVKLEKTQAPQNVGGRVRGWMGAAPSV